MQTDLGALVITGSSPTFHSPTYTNAHDRTRTRAYTHIHIGWTPSPSSVVPAVPGGPRGPPRSPMVLTKKSWRDAQEEQLAVLHVSFQTLWERGYFFDRTATITVSLEHSYQLSAVDVNFAS